MTRAKQQHYEILILRKAISNLTTVSETIDAVQCFARAVVLYDCDEFRCCSIDHELSVCLSTRSDRAECHLSAECSHYNQPLYLPHCLQFCIFIYAIINHHPLIFLRPPSLTARNVIFSLSVCSLESSPPPLVSSAIFFFKLSLLHTYCTLLSSHKP